MPWDIILTALGTTSIAVIILVVLGVFLAQKMIEQGVESYGIKIENSLKRAETAYENAVELGSQVDIHLRDQRIKVYGMLWKETKILPRWPRDPNVTYADICLFSERLKSWFFEEQGGMWLSKSAREAYGNLQSEIWKIVPERPTGPLSNEDYDRILEKCSLLRSELTDDLLSRRPAPMTA